ncbi:MAG: DUF3019 domain-containing protein [Gammaproteobacteria bacterium]|nr:DUF3019 domain-containing protein [Gammaproteobacteria bacterium]
MLLMNMPSAAEEIAKPDVSAVTMNMSPNQCVAMTEGQTCYVDVEFSWQSSTVLDVCLFHSSQKTPLKCWNQATKGEYEYDFASNKNVTFTLRRIDDLSILGQQELEMAWVHKKRGKPTNWWRIF